MNRPVDAAIAAKTAPTVVAPDAPPMILDRVHGRRGVYLFDGNAIAWRDTGKQGVTLKIVREDRAAGHFLGLIGFEPFTRSGLHQHQGVASSWLLDGGLVDYAESMIGDLIGINLAGSTHDAIAYRRTLLMSRLEGPVLYPPDSGKLHDLHVGSRHGEFVNPAPDVSPDIILDPFALKPVSPGIGGLMRRTVFDYANTGSNHRMVMLTFRPGTTLPMLETSALTEFWVHGGGLEVEGAAVNANGFVILEPGARVRIGAPFGANVVGWAEGPTRFDDGAPELFGF